jgi:hypothetical protein
MEPRKTLAGVMESGYAAKARMTTGIVFVERACDMPENEPVKGYWYDIQPWSGERKHDFLYDDLAAVIETLYEQDVPVDELAWEVTEQHVDFGSCACQDCKRFCLQHHVIPPGTPFALALCYRARFLWQDLCWWLWLRFLLFRERLTARAWEAVESGVEEDRQVPNDEEGA